MFVLNVPVADLICQIIIENDVYAGWFKKAYRFININNDLHHIQIIIRKGQTKQTKINIAQKYCKAIIHLPKKQLSFNYLSFLVETTIASMILRQQILLLHACSLIINNYAYVFCGDVGAGKSTIRKLGNDYLSLSDDTTIIKKEMDKYFVYLSPFDKTKGIITNHPKVSLGKIFILQKAKKNYIQSISSIETINQLINNNLLGIYNPAKNKNKLYMQSLELASTISIQKLYFIKSQKFLELMNIH